MKLPGFDFSVPHTEVAVIPRGDKKIVFTAKAINDFTDFDAICPRPKPPVITFPGKPPAEDRTDKNFLIAVAEWLNQRNHWVAIKSLEATEGLVWETVEMGKPETWGNWVQELQKANFVIPEINMIHAAIQRANSLDDAYLEAARESFFQEQRSGKQS